VCGRKILLKFFNYRQQNLKILSLKERHERKNRITAKYKSRHTARAAVVLLVPVAVCPFSL
jgi:hypothetical protein